MRTVTFTMNISLDGYCDHTLATPSAALMDYFTSSMDEVDLLFFGRVMYEMMFPYWADVARDQSGSPDEVRFAERFTAIDKVVVSRTIETVMENARIIRGNPAEELLKLKQQPGKNISIDSVSMLPELAHLIDEFHLVIHPIIVGSGRPLFPHGSLTEALNLKLVDTIVFDSGAVAHHYVKQ